MVGVNSFIYRLSAVAIIATFCAAIQIHNEKGFLLDFERAADFELECDGVKSSWSVNEDPKDSPGKKVLILPPEADGCFKSKNTVSLNSTTPVFFSFYRDTPKEDSGKFVMRLVPKTGSCPDEECVWDIVSDPQYKAGEWVIAEHKFPLKSIKDCYVQVQVDKAKGKFLADKISVSTLAGQRGSVSGGQEGIDEYLPYQLVPLGGNSSNSDVLEISKNLILTTASLVTLNVVLN